MRLSLHPPSSCGSRIADALMRLGVPRKWQQRIRRCEQTEPRLLWMLPLLVLVCIVFLLSLRWRSAPAPPFNSLSLSDRAASVAFENSWFSRSQPLDFRTAARINLANTPHSPSRPVFRYQLRKQEESETVKQEGAEAGLPACPPVFEQAEDNNANRPPVVSVVTTVFNVLPADFSVEETILHGSFQSFEWIVVNDGSSEAATLQLLDRLRAHADPRIRVVDLPVSGGAVRARNLGASMASAQSSYLLFADADDLCERTYLEKCILFLHFHPHYSLCNAWPIGGEQSSSSTQPQQQGFAAGAQILQENTLSSMTMLRRSAFQAAGGFDEAFSDDGSSGSGSEEWELWLHLLSQGHWGSTLPEALIWEGHRSAANSPRVRRAAKQAADGEGARSSATKRRLRTKHAELYMKQARGGENVLPSSALQQDHAPWFLTPEQPPLFNPLSTPLAPVGDAAMLGALDSFRASGEPSSASGAAAAAARLRPRLLLCTHWSVTGGGENFNLRLVRELARAGWEVTLLFTALEDPADSILPHFRRFTNDIFFLRGLVEPAQYGPLLLYLIHSRRPDVLFLTGSMELYFQLEYVRDWIDDECRRPLINPSLLIVDYVHLESDGWMQGGYSRMALHNQYLTDRSLFASEAARKWVIDRGGEAAHSAAVYIGTDLHFQQQLIRMMQEEHNGGGGGVGIANQSAAVADSAVSLRDAAARASFRARYNISADALVILMVARVTKDKLPHVFVESLRQLARSLQQQEGEAAEGAASSTSSSLPFYAFLLGSGPELASVRAAVSSSPELSGVVHLLGLVHDPWLLHSCYSAADVLFQPTRKEGISLALMDGMSYELVPVSVDIGGQREIVGQQQQAGKETVEDEANGFLIELREENQHRAMSAEFARIFLQLLSQPDLLAKMSAAALRRIQSFTTRTMMQSFFDQFCIAFAQRQARWNEQKGTTLPPSALHAICPTSPPLSSEPTAPSATASLSARASAAAHFQARSAQFLHAELTRQTMELAHVKRQIAMMREERREKEKETTQQQGVEAQ